MSTESPVADATRVTVAVVSWNSHDLLKACLESLDPLQHEVVVVDNDSSDGSAAMVAEAFPRAVLVRQSVNIGFGAAINLASYRARGRYLLLLNTDAHARAGAIDRLADFLDGHDDYGAVAGLLVDSTGTPQRGFNVRRFPTLASFAVDFLLIDRVWPSNPISRRYLAQDLDYERGADIEQPAAAALMLRLDAFRRVGRMDERFYPAWFEDVDLCRRLRKAGWRISFDPGAVFEHQGGIAMRALGLRAFSEAWYRNLLLYVRKHHGRVQLGLLRALLAVGMLERMMVSLVRGDREARQVYASVLRYAARGR
ncbi:MAG: glycosyltransferase family 2 protein [Acidobacteria bacterium]|nr:glycosyltransferase family 2 protein [Acidobacteriota bacterium]